MDIKKFVKDHKKEIIIGGAVCAVVVGGVIIFVKRPGALKGFEDLGEKTLRIHEIDALPGKVSMEVGDFTKGSIVRGISFTPEEAKVIAEDILAVAESIKEGAPIAAGVL